MEFKGKYVESTMREDFYLKLADMDGKFLELQAVDANGRLLEGGHLLRIRKDHEGNVKFTAYSGVSDKFHISLIEDGYVDVAKGFH